MKTLFALVSATAFLAVSGPCLAQKAVPLDTAAAAAQLSQAAKKPRFTPKSPIRSRTYNVNAKGAGVEIIEFEDGQKEERPYVAVPILFVVGKDELLDSVSSDNVTKTASVLREIIRADPKARFTVQGHTSAEGDEAANQALSEKRAAKIVTLLTAVNEVPASQLSQSAFGEMHAAAKETAPEADRQRDRRVLIVRD